MTHPMNIVITIAQYHNIMHIIYIVIQCIGKVLYPHLLPTNSLGYPSLGPLNYFHFPFHFKETIDLTKINTMCSKHRIKCHPFTRKGYLTVQGRK